MSSQAPITFFDIASAPPLRTFAANPWKTRLALNFKGVKYRTQWCHLPDISALRKELGISANRTLPDGEPFCTLPIIQDQSTGSIVGDSFEIALYLDRTYPNTARLIRPLTTGLVASFNARVDGIFTKYVMLCSNMPFPSESLDATLAIFAKRAAAMSVKQLSHEEREGMFVAFENDLGEFAESYKHTGGTTDWFWRPGGTEKAQRQPGRDQADPWLDDEGPSYADFIVGAWLKMYRAAMNPGDWVRVSKFQDGLWGKVVDALEAYSQIV